MENKKITIIIYIAMLIIAIGGISIAIYEKENNPTEQEYVDSFEDRYKDDSNYKKESEEDDKEEYEEEYEEENQYTSLDKYLDKYTYTVTKEDREELINATNIRNSMADEIYGAMFNEEISNDFKLYYTANQLVKFVAEKTNQPIAGEIKISEKVLLVNAQKIFLNVDLPENYSKELDYFGTYKINCKDQVCTFTQDTFGITGITPIDGYETKITELGSTLRTKVIYIDEEMIDYNNETNIYTFNAKLYDKHNGTLLKTINNYELDLSQSINVYDEFSPHYENIDEYIYLFNENNQLISVTKKRLN